MNNELRHKLVPLVDCERDPNADMDACVKVLLAEGWAWQAVGEWVRQTYLLRPAALRLASTARRN